MGLVLTLADPQIGGYDAVPDVLGWLLVVLGLRGLGDRIALSATMPLALLSGIVSLSLIRVDWLGGLPASTGWLLSLPQFAFSWMLCGEVRHLAGPDLAKRFRLLRWAFLVAAVGPVLLYGGGIDVLLIPLAVIAVTANVYLVYLLFRASSRVEGAPIGPPRS